MKHTKMRAIVLTRTLRPNGLAPHLYRLVQHVEWVAKPLCNKTCHVLLSGLLSWLLSILLRFKHGVVIVILLAVNYHLCDLSLVTRSLSTDDFNSNYICGGFYSPPLARYPFTAGWTQGQCSVTCRTGQQVSVLSCQSVMKVSKCFYCFTAPNLMSWFSQSWWRGIVVRPPVLPVCFLYPCARLTAGRVTTLWVKRPLSVSQQGWLSLLSLRGWLNE